MTAILDHINRAGLTTDQYLAAFRATAAAILPDDADEETCQRLEFTQLNLHRTERILRTWQPSAALAAELARLTRAQTWLVLTEPWCGDSAQCLPCIEVMAGLQPAISLRMVLRDENLDLMDQYLTKGKRSIPRLVAFDAEGNETFGWGPRPAAAQAVFDQAKAEDLAKPDLLERLHLFYGRDRGAALDAEFVTLLAGRQ